MGFFKNTYRTLLGGPSFRKFNEHLIQWAYTGLGVGNYESDQISGEAPFLQRYLKPRHYPSGIVLDVGANIGHYSKALHQVNPSLEILAFEPHPRTFEVLQKSTASNPQIRCFPFGFGKEAGNHTLFDHGGEEGTEHASLHQGALLHAGYHQEETQTVQIKLNTIDHFLETEGINQVLFLKIDTEGHEYAILQGAKQALQNGRILWIQFEFNEMNVASRVFFKDFWDLLKDYRLFRLTPNGLMPIHRYSVADCEVFRFQNFVAAHRAVVMP
ncbi:MAG: FkbM family methyltransferase [Bacteroidia bacterium]